MFINPSTFFSAFPSQTLLASDLVSRIHSTLLYPLTLFLLTNFILCIINFGQSPTQRLSSFDICVILPFIPPLILEWSYEESQWIFFFSTESGNEMGSYREVGDGGRRFTSEGSRGGIE